MKHKKKYRAVSGAVKCKFCQNEIIVVPTMKIRGNVQCPLNILQVKCPKCGEAIDYSKSDIYFIDKK
jgi:cytochrome c-type biogenesis protein CcmH/NrfF